LPLFSMTSEVSGAASPKSCSETSEASSTPTTLRLDDPRRIRCFPTLSRRCPLACARP
jgi:hypothetical protein